MLLLRGDEGRLGSSHENLGSATTYTVSPLIVSLSIAEKDSEMADVLHGAPAVHCHARAPAGKADSELSSQNSYLGYMAHMLWNAALFRCKVWWHSAEDNGNLRDDLGSHVCP